MIVGSFWQTIDELTVDPKEFLQDWAFGMTNRMQINKKGLDAEMLEKEIYDIFCNSGYTICTACQKIVEDDHKCQN